MKEAPPWPWSGDALALLARWPRERRVCLLHSGRQHPRWATHSLLAEPAGTYQFTLDGRSIWRGALPPWPLPAWTHHPWHDLRALLKASASSAVDPGLKASASLGPGVSALGKWIGYLGYDLGRWVEKLPTRAAADRAWPIIELAWCPGWAEHDLQSQSWTAHGTWAQGVDVPLVAAASACVGDYPHDSAAHDEGLNDWTATTAPSAYQAAVRRALDYIAAGDVFQVNLAQRFTRPWHGSPRRLYERLAAGSPAWYGAYLELEDGRVIASTSPELFLQMDAAGQVVTRPIKGTRPASTPVSELRDSAKDAAELHMIVDLLRNDLGRVCSYGSIAVEEARAIETHPTVQHGVATITGRLHPRHDGVALLRATMPGGSVTGAPKVRAMEIIDELEPVRRGPYCGAIGWIDAWAMQFNLAIRTLLLERSSTPCPLGPDSAQTTGTPTPSCSRMTLAQPGDYRLDFSVGGGIVADSDPAAEYAETLVKAQALRAAIIRP